MARTAVGLSIIGTTIPSAVIQRIIKVYADQAAHPDFTGLFVPVPDTAPGLG